MSAKSTHHAAVDLGAESGRIILGTLTEGRLSIEEIHRFSSQMREKDGGLKWDLRHLEKEIILGLKKIGDRMVPLTSVGCDSWGVDIVYLPANGTPPSDPFCYRDPRTERFFQDLTTKFGRSTIGSLTGVQLMAINTLYQVAADVTLDPEKVEKSKMILLIADYLNHFLGGQPVAEVSLASTTQMYDPKNNHWNKDMIKAAGFPSRLLPKIVPSGTKVGVLRPELAVETGLPPTCQVVASCSHDTAAAVAAVPVEKKDWAYLSSGTWSLLGVERKKMLFNDDCLALALTNEVGFAQTIRFLKNIAGLWLVQECQRDFAQQGRKMDYEMITRLAAESPAFQTLLDPFLPEWNAPGEMTRRIAEYAKATGQSVPASDGAFVRTCLESLTLAYRETLDALEKVTGEKISILHIVGGGCKNRLLNQMVADATGKTVITGPIEATAIGNILVQAAGLGLIEGLGGIRQVVRASFQPETFTPQSQNTWEEAWQRFQTLRTPKGK
jgi:rhamnulokinase